MEKLRETIVSLTTPIDRQKAWGKLHKITGTSKDFEGRFFWSFYPETNRYLASCNPVWIGECLTQLKKLDDLSVILLRDGVYPLSQFFTSEIKPESVKVKLAIPKEFAGLVPKIWRKKVLLYSTVVGGEKFKVGSSVKNNSEAPTIVLTFFLHPDFCNFSKLESDLQLIRQFALKMKSKKILLSLKVPSHYNFITESIRKEQPLILNQLFKGLPKETEIVSWEDLQRYPNLGSSYFFNLSNEPFWISDFFSDFFLLSRGSTPLSTYALDAKSSAISIPISLNHRLLLSDNYDGIPDNSSNYSGLSESYLNSKRICFGMSSWGTRWIR